MKLSIIALCLVAPENIGEQAFQGVAGFVTKLRHCKSSPKQSSTLFTTPLSQVECKQPMKVTVMKVIVPIGNTPDLQSLIDTLIGMNWHTGTEIKLMTVLPRWVEFSTANVTIPSSIREMEGL